METNTNPTGIEKSNQLVRSSDDLIMGSGHVRSYTCAFCKRGFSNAQALGGHMNIHRKDRAKLRQFAEENLLSLDISKTCSIENSDVSEEQSSTVIILESSEEKSCTPKRPCSTLSREDGDIEELQQITFFAETPSSSSGDIKASSCSTCTKDTHAEKKMQSGHSSSQIELDLELRLGPEPHETSNTSTKEFFGSSGNYAG